MKTNITVKTVLAAFLALCMLLGMFTLVSCADSNNPSGNPTPSVNPTSTDAPNATPTAAEKIVYKADIPDNFSWGDTEFRISVYDDSNSTWYDCDFDAEELNSDVINDAAFRRMSKVEEDYDVDIVRYPSAKYGFSNLDNCTKNGLDDYECGIVAARNAVSLAESGAFYDLLDSSTGLDYSAAWWDQNCVDGISINDRLYMIAGDISILYRKSLRVMYFNKKLASDNNITDLYDLVENGNWTIEKLTEYSTAVAKELDGDDKRTSHDCWGIIYTVDTMGTGLIGAGVSLVTKDADGYLELAFYNDETVDVFDAICNLIYDADAAYCGSINGASESDPLTTTNMFMSGHALFSSCELHNVVHFREMETDFGILPNAKYSEDQEFYRSTPNPVPAGMTVIPVTVPADRVQKVSYILDALGAESKNDLTPAYMDIYLQGRVTRDDESEKSLELVFNNVVFDLGYIYNWGNIQSFVNTMVNSHDTNLASAYDKIESVAQTAMDKAMDAYRDMP